MIGLRRGADQSAGAAALVGVGSVPADAAFAGDELLEAAVGAGGAGLVGGLGSGDVQSPAAAGEVFGGAFGGTARGLLAGGRGHPVVVEGGGDDGDGGVGDGGHRVVSGIE